MKKKHGLLFRIFFAITSPFVLIFVFFWGVFGQFLRPIFLLVAIVVTADIFAPGNEISQQLGLDGLWLFKLVTVLYLLVRPILAMLFLGLKEGIKIFLKDILIVVFLLFIIMVIFFAVKRI